MFSAICPRCSTQYNLDDSLIGKRATCKQCREIFLLEKTIETRDTVIQTANFDPSFDLKPPLPEIMPLNVTVPVEVLFKFPPFVTILLGMVIELVDVRNKTPDSNVIKPVPKPLLLFVITDPAVMIVPPV